MLGGRDVERNNEKGPKRSTVTCYVREALHYSQKMPIYELLNRASRRRCAVSRAA
jgi:hypothetical protein